MSFIYIISGKIRIIQAIEKSTMVKQKTSFFRGMVCVLSFYPDIHSKNFLFYV